MKKLAVFFVWTILHYCLIAGLAWRFVLGQHFPFWKLLIIAVLSAVTSVIQYCIFSDKRREAKK